MLESMQLAQLEDKRIHEPLEMSYIFKNDGEIFDRVCLAVDYSLGEFPMQFFNMNEMIHLGPIVILGMLVSY